MALIDPATRQKKISMGKFIGKSKSLSLAPHTKSANLVTKSGPVIYPSTLKQYNDELSWHSSKVGKVYAMYNRTDFSNICMATKQRLIPDNTYGSSHLAKNGTQHKSHHFIGHVNGKVFILNFQHDNKVHSKTINQWPALGENI